VFVVVFFVSKIFVCGVVFLAHVAVLALLMNPSPGQQLSREELFVPTGFVERVDDRGLWDTSPLPDIKLLSPKLDSGGLVVVSFEDPEDNAVVVGSASSPRLSRVQATTPELIARKKGLVLKQPQTVVLAVGDGNVSDVRVTRSSGDDAIDEAAIEYARSLHWIAGTQEHRTQPMKVSLPVIFT
jgi:TonB family protein